MEFSRGSFLRLAALSSFSLLAGRANAGLHLHGFNNSVYVAEGDSISSDAFYQGGFGIPSTYARLYALTKPTLLYYNLAVSGNELLQLINRSPLPETYKGNGKNVLSVLIGHNDIANNYPDNGSSRANFLAALAGYLDARRAAGLKVVLCTQLPSTVVGFNTERNACNAVMSTWSGLHCDAICDFGADPTMGPDAAAADLSLYIDGIHPTALGQANMKAIITPTLDALL